MPARIVEIDATNARCLDAVAPDVFDNAVDAVQLNRFVGDPRHILVVAIDDGLVVGMATAVEYFHPDKAPQLWINEVGVSPAYRGRSIGRELTGRLIEIARRRGCIFAWLGTDDTNSAAQACFSKVPGVETPQSFLLYEWDLDDA